MSSGVPPSSSTKLCGEVFLRGTLLADIIWIFSPVQWF